MELYILLICSINLSFGLLQKEIFFHPASSNVIMKFWYTACKTYVMSEEKSSKASNPQGGIQRTVFFLFNVVEFMVLHYTYYLPM